MRFAHDAAHRGVRPMMPSTVTPSSSSSNQTSSLVLTLSIGLQLLAFFVVLNASTTPDNERMRAVVASVQQSFGNDAAADPRALQSAAKAAAQVALRSSISDAFSRVLEGQNVLVRNDGDVLWVRTPSAAIFEPDTNKLRAVLPILDRLTSILSAPSEGLRYEMLITLSEDETIGSFVPAQAGALAADLLRRGLTASSFSLGTQSGTERTITFMFVVLADTDAPLSAITNGRQL
jgi:hypothetical protein